MRNEYAFKLVALVLFKIGISISEFIIAEIKLVQRPF